jgi:hypothetical protein
MGCGASQLIIEATKQVDNIFLAPHERRYAELVFPKGFLPKTAQPGTVYT